MIARNVSAYVRRMVGHLRLALGLFLCAAAPAAAQDAAGPQIVFNEAEIAALSRPTVDTTDPKAVLRHLLRGAGGEIVVYPSEGYYYFRFQNGPRLIAGNLRFDLMDAAQGQLNFAYYSRAAFGEDPVDHYSLLGPEDGIRLVTVSPFEYRLEFEGRVTRVIIYAAVDELAAPKPLASDELYIGPVFDESGVRLHLIFDQTEKAFFFVLNSMGPPADTFTPHPDAPLVQVGDRTGYVFFKDARHARWILVGVAQRNIDGNNTFDGPFDQLPDRFVDPDRMRELLELAYPYLAGRIGPRGVFLDPPHMRAMVAPYRRYNSTAEFATLSDCGPVAGDTHALIRCLQAFAYQ